ncbi:hypothetical protein HYV85_02440 [Candidatus Woesearchaeota archaeon]|nr:hypothetical protein [Candidatus Woesearchaeota archaeon]
MLHIAEAKHFGSGNLSFYDGFPWKDFSQKLGGLGYQQVREVPLREWKGSLQVLSRHNHSLHSFLPRDEPVQVSSAAVVRVSETGEIEYLALTRPGVQKSVEEIARDSNVVAKYFTDAARTFEVTLLRLRHPIAILAVYAGVGLAAGVGLGEFIYSHTLPQSTPVRYLIDADLGVLGAVGVSFARILFENGVRLPLLQRRAASQMNVASYLFGSEAVKSVEAESRAQQFETAAFLVYDELKRSGVAVDKKTFYAAFKVIQHLGVDKTQEITPVTKVPLEKIVEIVNTHPGLLPIPASAR